MADERSEAFSDVRQLKRNWLVPLANVALIIAGFFAKNYGAAHDSVWEPLGALVIWFNVWAGFFVLWRDALRLERKATLVASPSQFQVNDAAPIQSADVVEAKVIPQAIRGVRDVVELKVRRGPKWWQRRTLQLGLLPKDAARFMALIGTRAGERRASFVLATRYRWRFLAMLILFGTPWLTASLLNTRNGEEVIFIILATVFLGIVPFAAVAAMILNLLRGRLVVGAEGFTTHWYGWRRYRPFDTVKHIEALKQAGTRGQLVHVLVHGVDGSKRRLVAKNTPDTEAQVGIESRAMAATLTEAFDRWLRAPDVAKASAQLERGGRSGKDWLAGIDQLVRGGHGNYRVAAISADTLTEVARASDATTEARVGAATALLRLEGGAHRTTVRIAAEACAEPTTREALLELVEAHENETMIEAALQRVRSPR